jgi:uncharacterized Fe-S cluster protein YjdI
MSQTTHRYEKDSLTVIWQPHLCEHSGNCVRALGAVFKPRERPWVQPENAEVEEIMAAVDRCPSGALTYELS